MPTGTKEFGNLFGLDLSQIDKVCEGCSLPKNITEFYLRAREADYPNLYTNSHTCKNCVSARTAKKDANKRYILRQKILDKYGRKCVKCGFDDHRALQLDHVNGGGSREMGKKRNTRSPYRLALKDTVGKYQLLCANCNWIKRYENNEIKISALVDYQ